MIWRTAIVLAVCCCLTGCLRDGPRNGDCRWPSEPTPARAASGMVDPWHLTEDAELAEDLAIRYADTHWGLHTRHFAGQAEYGRARDRCLAEMFRAAALTHGVTETEVRAALGRRRLSWDLAVGSAFTVLYALAAYGIAGWLRRLYPAEGGGAARVLVTLLVAAVVSLTGVWVGELWTGSAENVRVGSGHLSYRGARVPWGHQSGVLFVGGVAVFSAMAALQRRRVRFDAKRDQVALGLVTRVDSSA